MSEGLAAILAIVTSAVVFGGGMLAGYFFARSRALSNAVEHRASLEAKAHERATELAVRRAERDEELVRHLAGVASPARQRALAKDFLTRFVDDET